MGNAESQLTPPSSTRSIPVPIPSRENKTIISESPVAGSPLQIAGSIDSYTEKKVDIPPSPPRITRKDNFIQPAGEKPYKNSSKIIHQFGSLGLAPLQPIGTVKKNIPVMIVWSHAGQVVHLTGSFNNWKRKIRLTKSTEDFTTIVDMPPGKHSLKFIVDDEWKCSEDLPVEEDQDGNLVNYISVNDEEGRSVEDGLQDISDDFGMEKEIPDSPVESYLCNLPLMRNDKQPPSLPAQLQKVLLNSKSITQDDPYILPVPNHVSLNHLYACSIRDGVMAISSTSRYRKKITIPLDSISTVRLSLCNKDLLNGTLSYQSVKRVGLIAQKVEHKTTLMYRERLPLFEIDEITPEYMNDMQGTPIENDKQVQLSVFNHRENKRTEINVSIPKKINLDFFKQHMYSVVEAKVDCKDNVAWTGNGRVGVYGSVNAAGEASFTADQVYSFLSIRYYGNRDDLSEYDSLIREKEYQQLIESVLANGVPLSKGGVPLTVFKASNINGEFKGVVSPELYGLRRIPKGETFEVSYTPFFNGSLSITNGGFDGAVSINLKELEFKSIGDVIVKRLPKELNVWFRADQVSYNGKFNYTYITLSGNTVGQSHFAGMGGLLNLRRDNSWIHFDRHRNQFFRSDRLIAIIPLLLLFSFFVFFMVKNKKKYLKYFKYRSVENKN